MAPDPMNKAKTAAFPAAKLAPFLRGLLDPEGTGRLPDEQLEPIKRVESNTARQDESRADSSVDY